MTIGCQMMMDQLVFRGSAPRSHMLEDLSFGRLGEFELKNTHKDEWEVFIASPYFNKEL